MKCRACWAEKAYVREVRGWRGVALNWLGFVPLKCQHCYHKFSVLRLLAIGQELTPPARKTPAAQPQLSVVASPDRRANNMTAAAGAPSQSKAA